MNILIKDALIVSMDDRVGIINNGYVLISGSRIIKVGSGEFRGDTDNTRIIDGSGYCVMPGLINCHTHAAMTLLRGYGEGLPLMRWLNEKIWPMENKFKHRHVEIGTKLACIEMMRSGTTTFNDMYFMEDEVFKAAYEFNMRAVLGISILGENWKEQLKSSVELMGEIKNNNKDGLIDSMIAPHSPYTLSYEALVEASETALEHNKIIHIHIAETDDEEKIIREKYGKTPCEMLLQAGIFKNRVVGAHCVHLSDSDIEILKESDASPVYNAQSNMKLASGVSRVSEMLDENINVCIGTDGVSSNNNLNMFEEMETGAMLQKLWYKDATKLGAYDVLRMATVNGAKALGIEKLGAIKESYKADIIMLNLNKPHMVPDYDIYSNLVFSANGSEVEYVIINGKLIMDKGEFVDIDEDKVMFELKNLCSELVK